MTLPVSGLSCPEIVLFIIVVSVEVNGIISTRNGPIEGVMQHGLIVNRLSRRIK